MNYLAIDTSGKNLTIIIKKDKTVHKFHDTECGVNHSVQLMPRVEELCEKANFSLSQADFFACVVGPGSFTGIRIGVATVKALCFAYSKPCLSVTSFDTMAYNEKSGKKLVLIDAKHNGFYVCGYAGSLVSLQPCYLMREKVEELIKDYDKVLSFEEINGFSVEVVSIADGLEKAIEQKMDTLTDNIEELTPLYVRKSQAEEGR